MPITQYSRVEELGACVQEQDAYGDDHLIDHDGRFASPHTFWFQRILDGPGRCGFMGLRNEFDTDSDFDGYLGERMWPWK